MRIIVLALSTLTLWPTLVQADQKGAKTCAAELSAPARQIYDAVNALKLPVNGLPQIVREQTVALVQSGQIAMSTAPDHATAAARCLELRL